MCVYFLPIHSGHEVRWTYQPESHKRKVPVFIHLPSAVRALIFLARRIQQFLSLVDREVVYRITTDRSKYVLKVINITVFKGKSELTHPNLVLMLMLITSTQKGESPKRLSGNIGCRDKNSSKGFPNILIIASIV